MRIGLVPVRRVCGRCAKLDVRVEASVQGLMRGDESEVKLKRDTPPCLVPRLVGEGSETDVDLGGGHARVESGSVWEGLGPRLPGVFVADVHDTVA